MDNQRTIAREFSTEGAGLHTANKVRIVFKPAPVDSGIYFVRTDLAQRPVIKASTDNLLAETYSQRRTCVGTGDIKIYTIEHLMAALCGLGIDNLCIELSGEEVPGLDGSSLNFLELFSKAGIQEQDKLRSLFSLKEPVFIEDTNASLVALPSSDYKISYALDYQHPYLSSQFLSLDINSESFRKELAGARTFCLEEEAAQLQQQGLGLGANYENTLVVGKSGVIKNKLRFADEFVRHKILDLVGDLYLLGPIKARIIAVKSGHHLNMKLIRKIDQQKKRYALAGVGAGANMEDATELDVNAIMKILPHRQPFLFVDRITHMEKGKRITGIKNVSINDYFFKGHFPGKPVMPGVLIVEAMAQVGGVMMLSQAENQGKIAYFLAADNVKFRKTVVPGDQLVMDVVAGKIKSRTGQVHGKAYVDGKLVAEADLMFALADV